MISVITPTHNPQFLAETADSLRRQTYRGNWEWLIVPNGAAADWSLAPEVAAGLPVSLARYPAWGRAGVGPLKRFACAQAKGEVILELDHDDLLAPQALERVAETFADPEVGFCYSNFAEFRHGTWEPNRYDEQWGWRYRDTVVLDRSVAEARGFPPSADSLMSIHFAPNHLRAWRASVYQQIGGHDPEMAVADDHDLCCRFYLTSRMVHLDECLYLYRLHNGNTYSRPDVNPTIQAMTQQVRDRYLDRLVERWADLQGLPKVDICCGAAKPQDWLGVDLRGGNIKHDLNERWPFEDNSVGIVRAVDALEHLRDPVHTMTEIFRVLAPGGWLLSSTPSTDGRGAFQDPTHVSWWNEHSWWYWTRAQYRDFVGHGARFQAMRVVSFFPSDWHRANNIAYVRADLVALKDGYRAPGAVEI